jgi:hypothetical protein
MWNLYHSKFDARNLLLSKNSFVCGNVVPPTVGRKGHLSKFYCLNDGKIYDSMQAGWATR